MDHCYAGCRGTVRVTRQKVGEIATGTSAVIVQPAGGTISTVELDNYQAEVLAAAIAEIAGLQAREVGS